MGGSNDATNLVVVPERVHFILHWLLTRMTTGDNKVKMHRAFWRMMNPQNVKHNRTYRVTSRQYEKTRAYVKRIMIENNPMFSAETKAKKTGVKRPEQAEVARLVNEKRWAGEREPKAYEHQCKECGCDFKTSTPSSKFCTISCSSTYFSRVSENSLSKGNLGKPSWNAGKKCGHSSDNGKNGALKLSEKVTGRKMAKRPDGSRYWVYPNDEQYLAVA
jgi:hypothetical protein